MKWLERNQDKIAMVIGLLLVLFLISSCGCNYHLRKAHQKCGVVTLTDTITVRDTFYVHETRIDTVFQSKQGDTIYLNKDRLHIKYVKLPGDSVYINGKCDTVFVNRIIKVPHEKIVLQKENWLERHMWWIWLILAFILLLKILQWLTK